MHNFRHRFRLSLGSRILFAALILLLSFVFVTKVFANEESERLKIAYLLNAIGSSDLVFISNGLEYTGKEAMDHLQEKMDSTGGRIHTAEEFIAYIGSESSTTGIPYHVRLADGTVIKSETWLRGVLARMKEAKDNPH